jgi:hypothetical protein
MVFMAITQLDLYELFPERAVTRGNELVRAKTPVNKDSAGPAYSVVAPAQLSEPLSQFLRRFTRATLTR